jgi:hypothetical protein
MKKWYKSRVLWFNVAVAIGAAVESSLSMIQGYFDPRVFLALIGLTAGVNVVLRFMTTTSVTK